MAGDALRPYLEPNDLFFRNRDAEHELAVDEKVTATEPTFVQDVLGIELLVMILDHPSRAQLASDLFVGHRHENDVTGKWNPGAFEGEKGVEMDHA